MSGVFSIPFIIVAWGLFLNFAGATELTQIIFFGGHGASAKQMEDWKRSAEGASGPSSEFTFTAIPYPSQSWEYENAVRDGKAQIKALVEQINANPKGKFILAGHSSGAALAIEVARVVKNPERINLVILDGFRPNLDFQKKIHTKCWTAADGERKNLRSTNYFEDNSCKAIEVYRPFHCRTPTCLHYSLVNKSPAIGDLGPTNSRMEGYKQLSPNLIWLRDFRKTQGQSLDQVNDRAKP